MAPASRFNLPYFFLVVVSFFVGLVYSQPTTVPPATSTAQLTYPATPLASKGPFAYPSGIPYKVDTDTNLVRGTQLGYNICNSTTENQNSLCQTSFLNSLDDFCLWAPTSPGHTISDTEGSLVAWCTKPGHGTRLIPAGALTGVQFTKTPDYVQVVGFIDQTLVNIPKDDFGGEMDPHGADLRGNPMGGILFSTAFTGQHLQAVEWHNFIGSSSFCLKACSPSSPNAAHYCEHIYDRLGCAYNAPNAALNGVFESCEGENQDFPGVYASASTDTANGRVVTVTMTYTQPPESLGPITSVPYTARVPASSNCKRVESTAIFTGLPTPTGAQAQVTTAGNTGKKDVDAVSRTGSGAGGPLATAISGAAQGRVVAMGNSGFAVVVVLVWAAFSGMFFLL